MQMNLFENIKIFIEIVDAGSFSQAAENLQIHRPAVTKALQQLERESGVRLLQRTTRRLYLTPEGEEFYRRSKPLLSQADDLLESFAPDRPIRGQLRVDMPIAFARLLVIPHLADFYQAHPEVEIVLSSSDVRRDMLRDGLDCLLRVGIWRMATMWRARWGGGVNHLRESCVSGSLWSARHAGGTAVAPGGELGTQQQPTDYALAIPDPGGHQADRHSRQAGAGQLGSLYRRRAGGAGDAAGDALLYSPTSTAASWWKFYRTFRRRVGRCRCSIRTGIFRTRCGSLPTGCRGWWRPWRGRRRLDSAG